MSLQNVNILAGNVMTCGQLPAHDPAKSKYQCGSQSLNDSLYMALTTIGIITLVIALAVWMSVDVNILYEYLEWSVGSQPFTEPSM